MNSCTFYCMVAGDLHLPATRVLAASGKWLAGRFPSRQHSLQQTMAACLANHHAREHYVLSANVCNPTVAQSFHHLLWPNPLMTLPSLWSTDLTWLSPRWYRFYLQNVNSLICLFNAHVVTAITSEVLVLSARWFKVLATTFQMNLTRINLVYCVLVLNYLVASLWCW